MLTAEQTEPRTIQSAQGRPARLFKSPRGRAPLYLVLWLLLWCGYNTGPWYVLDPSFPATTAELIHGVRAFFPLLAGWLALIMILARGGVNKPAFMGPLGLLCFYTIIGLTSSLFCANDIFQQSYWGVA